MTYKHQIDIEQNKPERLELLRAQRLFYARAKLYQNWFAILAILLLTIGVVLGAHFPAIRPWVGLGSIAFLLLDVGLFARLQRENCKRGARVQEQFDTEVLKLNWNKLVSGGRVDAEDVRAITSTPMTDLERKDLENWYEVVISELPLPIGRLLCQRTNVAYDSRVRTKYANLLLAVSILLFIVLTVVGLFQGLKLDELILTLYLPALPLVAYSLREHRKQGETIETLGTIKGEVEKVWERALAGASFEELTTTSRALQDAIFRHRASNPLVFDWLYDWARKGNEDLTRYAAAKFVAEVKQKLNPPEAQ